jgi:hypothetical protein
MAHLGARARRSARVARFSLRDILLIRRLRFKAKSKLPKYEHQLKRRKWSEVLTIRLAPGLAAFGFI